MRRRCFRLCYLFHCVSALDCMLSLWTRLDFEEYLGFQSFRWVVACFLAGSLDKTLATSLPSI